MDCAAAAGENHTVALPQYYSKSIFKLFELHALRGDDQASRAPQPWRRRRQGLEEQGIWQGQETFTQGLH
jgi:hypothetical protein